MTHYVLGFAFNPAKTHFVGIDKRRGPVDVVDHINGVGGHVEWEESPIDAMVREFREETGVATVCKDWRVFADLRCLVPGHEWKVSVYKAVLTAAQFAACRSCTDEPVLPVSCTELHPRVVRNVPALVALARIDDPKLNFTRFLYAA